MGENRAIFKREDEKKNGYKATGWLVRVRVRVNTTEQVVVDGNNNSNLVNNRYSKL